MWTGKLTVSRRGVLGPPCSCHSSISSDDSRSQSGLAGLCWLAARAATGRGALEPRRTARTVGRAGATGRASGKETITAPLVFPWRAVDYDSLRPPTGTGGAKGSQTLGSSPRAANALSSGSQGDRPSTEQGPGHVCCRETVKINGQRHGAIAPVSLCEPGLKQHACCPPSCRGSWDTRRGEGWMLIII